MQKSGSSREPIRIHYSIRMADGSEKVFDVQLEPETLEARPAADSLPDWTRLDYHRCPHCPLDQAKHRDCPAAAGLVAIVDAFDEVSSFDEVVAEVTTAERNTIVTTTAQKAVGSLFGLHIATSGCPYTEFLKPMARFHLPFSSQEETIYRVSSMYLLAQYFIRHEGGRPDDDLKGLEKLYEDLHEVNVQMTARLRRWTTEDASVNAIVVLDVFANILPFAIEDELERIRPLFGTYLTSAYQDARELQPKEP